MIHLITTLCRIAMVLFCVVVIACIVLGANSEEIMEELFRKKEKEFCHFMEFMKKMNTKKTYKLARDLARRQINYYLQERGDEIKRLRDINQDLQRIIQNQNYEIRKLKEQLERATRHIIVLKKQLAKAKR
jgi:predicted RNase H-like nuclease (RuvC/YqgF family)